MSEYDFPLSHDVPVTHATYCAMVEALPIVPTFAALQALLFAINSNINLAAVKAIYDHAEATGGGGWREILIQVGVQADKVFPNPTVAATARTILVFCSFFLKMPAPSV